MNKVHINRALDRLQKIMPHNTVANMPLAKNNTFRVGGPAGIFAIADSLHELNIIVGAINDYDLPFLLLGRGSNLLISDTGFPGVVLQLGKEFQQISAGEDGLLAGAAATLTALAQTALKHSLDGLSFVVGIPGTLGAAIAINAGAYKSQMSDIVRKVTIYDIRKHDQRLLSLNNKEIGFSYRSTKLSGDTIILEAALALKPGQSGHIKREMETNWRHRKESQPLGRPSAGSIFKNPEGHAAGKLIEESGCKGWRVGGAEVSEKHANYIINTGDASAQDIYVLLKKVQAEVAAKSGITLESEIKIVGEFEPV